MASPDPFLIVLFGATGDLARKKLLPALYGLTTRGDDARVRVLGTGRSPWDDAEMRANAVEALAEAGVSENDARAWAERALFYTKSEADDGFAELFHRIEALQTEGPLSDNRLYYLALPPAAFDEAIHAIGRHEQDRRQHAATDPDRDARAPDVDADAVPGWTRLVIEKPFGDDLDSARALNRLVHRYFSEPQVYRIDHYLGKETVQNLLVFRFANALFESVWHRHQVERVEILVAEEGGVEGRAGYYDGVGALRDMIQNHLTQLFTLTAMEPPAAFDAEAIRQEKIKVLRATELDAESAVYGQYAAAAGEDGSGEGYRDHDGVPADSATETYVALRLHVHNWRWEGVPFVLKTGKRMRGRRTEIAVRFRCPPVRLFGGDCRAAPNVLRIRLQPGEGFRLDFEVKAPGDGFRLSTQSLDFAYEDAFGELPDAYETLLRDVAAGDQTLFVHADEAEAAWALFAPLLDAPPAPEPYLVGSWGPEGAAAL